MPCCCLARAAMLSRDRSRGVRPDLRRLLQASGGLSSLPVATRTRVLVESGRLAAWNVDLL